MVAGIRCRLNDSTGMRFGMALHVAGMEHASEVEFVEELIVSEVDAPEVLEKPLSEVFLGG